MVATLLSLVPGRLVLAAEYAINCADADWVNPNDPSANCTRTKGILWQVNGSAAVHDAATDTRAATSAWVKVALGELSPAGAGRSWRLVAPYLSNTDA